MAECETRLEKGAEYVDFLQAQMDEMTVELENMKKAEEVWIMAYSSLCLSILSQLLYDSSRFHPIADTNPLSSLLPFQTALFRS